MKQCQCCMYSDEFPSEIARNILRFLDIKQQLLEFVIKSGPLFGFVVGVDNTYFIQTLFYKKLENPNLLQLVIVHE